MPPPADAADAMALLSPLTAKPVLFVANVEEGTGEVPPAIAAHAAAQGAEAVAVSARLEAELGELSDEDAAAMREDLGLAESGLQTVVRGAFSLPALVAFFTAGEDKPAQSWHLRRGLSVWHAAGLIHSDIQKGFVRAEVVSWDALRDAGGYAGARDRGHAAPRGPRLRGRRRGRDHRQVHALTACELRRRARFSRMWKIARRGYRSASDEAFSRRSASRFIPSPRAACAPPARLVSASVGHAPRPPGAASRCPGRRAARRRCRAATAAIRGRSSSAAAIAASSEP